MFHVPLLLEISPGAVRWLIPTRCNPVNATLSHINNWTILTAFSLDNSADKE